MVNETRRRDWHYPVTVWLIVLGSVFATEFGVMLALPWLLPEQRTRMLESAVDSITLSLVLAPILWWTVVRPLREVIRLRTKFLGDLFAAVEVERRQTAHDLHDGVGQGLTLLISGLRSAHETITDPAVAVRCRDLLQLAQAALKDVKRLALGLRPSLLDDLGLVSAVERLVMDIGGNHPLDLKLEAGTMIGVRLPEPVETAVFRIVQEAAANIIRHSGARRAVIELRYENEELILSVSDDGCGFDFEKSAVVSSTPGTGVGTEGGGHLGLIGMRERVAVLGGRFTVNTARGRGCRITAIIPIESRRHE